MQDNFEFNLISNFPGYESARDKTNIAYGYLVRGSKNVYKKLSGAIAVRFGLKRRGVADTTVAGIKSSYEWNTSFGKIRVLRVCNGKLQVESDIITSGTYVWYDLMVGLTTLTRFVFDAWYNITEIKDQLVFVMGNMSLLSWSGGIASVLSTTSTTITIAGTNTLAQSGFTGTQNMSLIIGGITYTYTARGISQNTQYNKTDNAANPTISSTQYHSQLFTTSANATQILQATTSIFIPSGPFANPIFTLAIYTDNAGVPGTILGSAQTVNPGSGSGALSIGLTANFSNLSVSPNTNYHLVIFQVSGTGIYQAKIGSSSAVGTNTSTDAGVTWNAENGYLYGTVVENIANAQTFVGVSPDPSTLLEGSVILQSITTNGNTPDLNFENDFLKVINNQVHIGSYSSPLTYISAAIDYTLYTVPISRVKGDPDLLTLDNTGKGITERQGKAVISAGTQDWYIITRTQITVGTTLIESVDIAKQPTAELEAAIAHEFIDTVGDDIVFLSIDQKIKVFGTVRNLATPRFPELSLPIQYDLKYEDFTGGHLRAVGDRIYITAPLAGRDYVHVTRQELDRNGNIVADRFWDSPQIRNISRIAVINGIEYGHSNSNPQIYQLLDTNQWHDDSPTDENLPYECRMRMAYRRIVMKSGERRQGKTSFDKVYYEGYMTQGSVVGTAVYMDYQGARDIQTPMLNDPTNGINAHFYSGPDAPSLGDDSLGDNPIGDGLVVDSNDQELLPKFRKITKITPKDVFEYQLEVYSNTADARWEILSLGTDEAMSEVNSVEITKK